MIPNFTKTLKVLTIVLLSIPCKSLAVIRYVNVSNATPGAGTSWATAYNNLTSALAVAGTFDQIWIAQGIYKPSTPAGRSATFSNTTGASIYGGFNGTETAVTQANPTLYPTILSGDIGVAGNASDNCYHVLTYNANLWIGSVNGVTIQDGQADAGSSSVAQPDNTGGGVVFLAPNSGNGTGTYFSNCTFANNYAFYGGAIGSYAQSALQVNYNAYNCFFHDNSAVYGGAVFNTNVATDYLEVFEDDIFYNNTASSGASVLGNAVTNGTSTEYFQMQNCLFYNEAAPIFTNDFTNSAFSSFSFNYNIVWTSGTPYTSSYSGGNTPLVMSSSDINGTIGSNMNSDPLFVNAAAYDFHVSPCSPVIDKGPSYSPATTDIGGSTRMQGSAVDIGPYETLKGTASTQPTVTTPVTLCQNVTASPLTATGTSLLWYTASTGGTGASAAPTPVTTSVGSTIYYVTQTTTGNCESPRTSLTVTIKAAATAPTASSPVSYCQNATATALTATGSNLLWYTTIGGASSTTAPTPVTTGAGTTDYYVTQTPAGSCESTPTTVTVTIKAGATAPTASPVSYCQNATATALTATGANLLWYTTIGGASSTTAPTPVTTSVGTTNYYVTQTPSGSCESTPTTITVTIGSPATAPTANPVSYCQNTTAAALTATGTNLRWYTTIGGASSTTAPIPVTTSVGTTDYYVTQTPAGSCESNPTTIPITINPGAAAPTANPVSYCQNTTAAPLTATGSNLLWYTTATGGTGDPNAPTPPTTTAGTTSYFVTQSASSCESPRTEIDVTINPTPSADFTWSTPCEGKATTITATSNTTGQYTWDFGADASVSGSGAGPIEVTWASSNTYTVTLTATTSGCQGQMQHLITVNPNPKVSIAALSLPLCLGNDIPLEATGASSYQWTPATNLSNANIPNPVVLLQNNIQYTVTGTDDNGCSATAQVTLDVSPDCIAYYLPDAFTPNGDGKNDEFRVRTADIPRSFTLMIFNRFGGKVFETTTVTNGWNGTLGGNAAPTGTYVYTMQATTSAGTTVKKQGTIILIR